jgi:hypothetical protein
MGFALVNPADEVEVRDIADVAESPGRLACGDRHPDRRKKVKRMMNRFKLGIHSSTESSAST